MRKKIKLWILRYRMRECAMAWQHAINTKRDAEDYEAYLADKYAQLSARELHLSIDSRHAY